MQSTQGVASGPLSFMQVFDAATETIKQGGKRRGANMGVLRVGPPGHPRVHHRQAGPDPVHQLQLQRSHHRCLRRGARHREYDLVDPSTREVALAPWCAREVFDRIIDLAWHNGEPGVLFIDAANRDNTTPQLGNFEATNPASPLTLWCSPPGAAPGGGTARPAVRTGGGRCTRWRSTDAGFFATGHKEILNLQTVEGYSLRLTADHLVARS